LQLQLCNVSPDSGKKYTPAPLKYDYIHSWTDDNTNGVTVYVDPESGSDDNDQGTASQPVKTIEAAVKLMRTKRPSTKIKGTIYLKSGYYFPRKPVSLTADDSNMAIVGQYGQQNTFISGAKSYSFNWKTYKKGMVPLSVDFSTISEIVTVPGNNYSKAKYIAKVANVSDCQAACEKDPSCFAFTWFDNSFGDFSNMCYFRADGLWVPTRAPGATSGRKVNILVADLSDQNPTPFTSLFLNGRRAVRARYPDGNPETMGLHTNPTGYVSSAVSWLPPAQKPPAEEIHIDSPQRNGTHFPQFTLAVGGPVDVFDPPESYWGTADPVGGEATTYTIPTGLVYSSNEEFASRSWQNPKTGVVHAFQCYHWGGWQFAVDGRNEETKTITWSHGGFQEARGCLTGQEWYVENIFEELDAPGEWFYNETEQKLYLFPNYTEGVPSSGYGTTLQQLLNIQGSMDHPVYNITIVNVTFMYTEPTFLESYEVPSAGDWAIHRNGAVFVEGVDGFTIQQCLFDSPGGNGLVLSNYIRNAVIEANEFRYSGDSSIIGVGSSQLVDGTDGNQPRGTKVISNLVHESGIWGKQTSPYMQSLACQTELTGNIFFNGPRAGINFNDGFGGGNLLKNNLLFNFVRETADHGVFNSWDRQPYLTKIKDGHTPSLLPATSHIMKNFIINNYHSAWPLDHDDGSCYYEDTYNFLVYGGYKNYLGHSKTVENNTYIYPDALNSANVNISYLHRPYCADHDGATIDILPSGWGEIWAYNKCVIGNPDIYDFHTCNKTSSEDSRGLVPMTSDNTFYTPHKEVNIPCGAENLTLQEYQKMGFDKGSVVHDLAEIDTATVVSWGRHLLDF
jgi:hypothetical protein